MSSFIFIDPRIADIERLIAGLGTDIEVVILDAAQDGIAQIAEALAGVTDVDSIHIISHGSPGTLYLGSTVVTENDLGDYEHDLALIGDALAEQGDILLYGCSVGAGPAGESFIASLAEYTGADVAASTDATGNSALGGDWVLETNTGAIEAQAIAATSFDSLLAPAIDLTDVAAGTGGFVIHGADAYDQSGFSVASAGDINGDGFDDLIIGAWHGQGAGNSQYFAGESYVIFGKADGFAAIDLVDVAAGTSGFVIYGPDPDPDGVGNYSARSGYSVASAGDINGDGFDDLVIGTLRGDVGAESYAGRTYVIFGKASGFAASIDLDDVAAGTGGFVVYGQDAGDSSGLSVASAGDLNGDGFDDLIIGAPGGDAAGNTKSGAGETYVVFGRAGGFDPSINLSDVAAGTGGFVIYGQDTDDSSGRSVASAGDVNGDGYDDLVIGARFGDAASNLENAAGDSYVIFGKASGFGASLDLAAVAAGTGGFVIHGEDAGDHAGWSVAAAGDINGDGYGDIIIGAHDADVYAGNSYVVFGKASGFGTSIDLAVVAGGTGGFVVHGDENGDHAGWSVASAGDVNGDGFDDVIVGAMGGDSANNGTNDEAGDSYVIFGKAGGFGASIDLADIEAGTGGFVIHGEDELDRSGCSVASAGDVNGDGFDDLIIGARYADAASNGKTVAGDSYVIFGTDFSGVVTDLGGSGADSLVGSADADIMVGGQGNDTLDGLGGADVMRGGAGADVLSIASVSFQDIDGGSGSDTLALSGTGMTLNLTAVADTGLTGIEVIDLIGTGNNTALVSALELLNISDSSNTLRIEGDAGDLLLLTVGEATWVRGDTSGGYTEYTSGQAKVEVATAVAVEVAIDLSDVAAGIGGFVIRGQDSGDAAGCSVASAGDINGDGFDDLIIGAFRGRAATNLDIYAGDSYLVFGQASGFGSVIDLDAVALGTGGFVIHGEDAQDKSGRSVASAGDVDGDGFDDIIIGAYLADGAGNSESNAGGSYILFGQASDFGASVDLAAVAGGTGGFVIHGEDIQDYSGRSVASAGDINGDGFDDLIIGAWGSDPGNDSSAGSSYVIFGKASGFGATIDLGAVAAGTGGFVINGQDPFDISGWRVASAGDINSDGFDDLIIGARAAAGAGNAKSLSGESYVVFGKASGFTASIDLAAVAAGTGGFVIYGEETDDRSGASVASAGDFNGDGFADLIIGAYYGDSANNGRTNAGDSYVVFGKASGFGASIDLGTVAGGAGGFVIHGQGAYDWSGSSVASAGDVNGDGYDDLIIGALRADGAGDAETYAGDSYVVFGKASGFGSGIDLADIAGGMGGFVIHGEDAGDVAGISVASAGDVNGDGFDDLFIGAENASVFGHPNAGSGYVIFGRDFSDVVTHPGGDGAESLNGSGGADIMIGGRGADTIDGTGGADVMRGGAGNDDFVSGSGADRMDGGNGNDTADYTASGAGITLNLATNVNNGGDAAGDKLADIENVIGSASGDTLTGDPNANTLSGLGGNDTLTGGAGNDTVVGGLGNNTIVLAAGGGIDRITDFGDGDAIRVTGAAFTTPLTAGDGSTVGLNQVQLSASGGVTTLYFGLDGTAGPDLSVKLTGTFSATGLRGKGNEILFNHTPTLANELPDKTAQVNTLFSFMVPGNTFADVDAGDSFTYTAKLVGGDDLPGWLSLNPTTGVFSGTPPDAEFLETYQIRVTARDDGNTPISDTFVLSIPTGGPNADSLTGTNGDDTIDAGGGADTMAGLQGSDIYIVDHPGDVVVETNAVDADEVKSSVTYTSPANVEVLRLTGSFAVNGTGNNLNNLIFGNAAGNRLDGGSGQDTLTGGEGNDTYVVDLLDDQVNEASGAGNDLVQSSVSYTLPGNVERLTLTGTSDINAIGNSLGNTLTGNSGGNSLVGLGGTDSMVGASGGDTLTGGSGSDTLISGGGNDRLNGGTGADSMAGGTGNDAYVVDNALDTVSENPGEGADVVESSVSWTLGDNVEDLLLIGGANRNGTGNALGNELTGNGGDNSLVGGGGNDTLDGGAGDDTLLGGAGNDVYFVDTAGDVVIEALNGGTADQVVIQIDFTAEPQAFQLYDNVELVSVADVNGGGILVIGNALDNLFEGGNAADSLDGAAGEDTLDGAGGDDTLEGGTGVDSMLGGGGSDLYYVDDVNDEVIETGNGPGPLLAGPAGLDDFTDTVIAVVNYSLDNVDFVENLTLSSTATQGTGNGLNNVITGNNVANTLAGLGGADTVVGSGGKDTLVGGAGADLLKGNGGGDRLTGEAGADTFEFNATLNASSNLDRIMDFVTGVDEIQLDRTVFPTIGLGDLALGAFYKGAGVTGAHDAGDRIVYNTTTGNLYYDADGSGAGSSAILFATLAGSPGLAYTDFFIVP